MTHALFYCANLDIVIFDVPIFPALPLLSLSSNLNDCETPMIHPIRHVLVIKIFPMKVKNIKTIGCRSAQLMSYCGSANMKNDVNVAIDPDVANIMTAILADTTIPGRSFRFCGIELLAYTRRLR